MKNKIFNIFLLGLLVGCSNSNYYYGENKISGVFGFVLGEKFNLDKESYKDGKTIGEVRITENVEPPFQAYVIGINPKTHVINRIYAFTPVENFSTCENYLNSYSYAISQKYNINGRVIRGDAYERMVAFDQGTVKVDVVCLRPSSGGHGFTLSYEDKQLKEEADAALLEINSQAINKNLL